MSPFLRRVLVAVCCSAALVASRASAQSVSAAARGASASCDYDHCALSIAPRWNGLALVQGTEGNQVANLNFFWPRAPMGVLAGSDSAERYGERAVRVRRAGAVLTDVGALLVGYALARRAGAGSFTHGTRAALATGVAAVAVSVPLQFAADGYLSRAVWWHNRQYAR